MPPFQTVHLRRVAPAIATSAAVGLLLVGSAAPVFAKGKPAPSGPMTIAVNPSPASVDTDVTISGTGYVPSYRINVEVIDPECTTTYFTTTDAGGSFSLTAHVYHAGTDTARTWDVNAPKQVVLATTTFEVVQP